MSHAKRLQAPRMGTAHLMLWTACVAAHLTLVRLVLYGDLNDDLDGPAAAFVVALSLLHGAAWAGLLLLVWRLWSARRAVIEPGHWLLALAGSRSLVSVLVTPLQDRMFASSTLLAFALALPLYLLPLFNRKLRRSWRGLFFLLLLIQAVPLALLAARIWSRLSDDAWETALSWMFWALPAVEGLLVLVWIAGGARGSDLQSSWLHRTGLAVWLLICLQVLFMNVVLVP